MSENFLRKLLYTIAFLALLLALLSTNPNGSSHLTAAEAGKVDQNPETTSTNPAAQNKPALNLQSASEVLTRGRALEKRLAESNKPKAIKDNVLITKKDVEDTKAALTGIDKNSPEYTEAQSILAAIDQREEEGIQAEKAAIAKAIADDAEGRRSYAKQYEQSALMAGYSMTATATGSKNTTFNLSYPLFSKALVYQVINDVTFQKQLGERGFKKLFVKGSQWHGSVDLGS